MNFGVFTCSACAGIHRELSHKVKGISMSEFNDAEIKVLAENGNEVAQTKLMKTWKAKRDPEPDKKDTARMKEWFRVKYVEKKFAQKEESDSSDEEPKKKKKSKKKKRASSSSESDEKPAKKKSKKSKKAADSGSESAEDFPKKAATVTSKRRGLNAPLSMP